MPNRLFVTSLKSIGLVVAGDNPESEVVIWKSRKTDAEKWAGLTIAAWDAIVEEERARRKKRLATVKKTLDEVTKRIDRLKKQRSTRLATIPERNPMTVTDKETPQELNELVKAKLDAYARRQQYEGEIAGRYGFLSTPREEMIIKIRAKWWDTADGQAVKDLVRERGGDPADLSMIQKSHGQAFAAIGRLDGRRFGG